MNASPFLGLRSTLASALVLFLAACGSGSGSGSSFLVRTTTQAASPSAALVVAGDWLLYFASETFTGPAGTQLNGDADTLDQVAFVVNLRSRLESNTGVAAVSGVVVDGEVYLVVDESVDGVDWDGDTNLDDFVLVHWSEASGTPVFLDLVESDARLVAVGDSLFYASSGVPLGVADETSLRRIDAALPTTLVAVASALGGAFPALRPLAEEVGVLFCALDESVEGVDYNNDGSATDDTVLAVLAAGVVDNTGLALADEDGPFAARFVSTNSWTLAFLVDEVAQEANLNDQALFTQPLLPENCAGTPDLDQLDEVLHYLQFQPLLAVLNDPVNTGLAGHDRVLVLSGFVATISDEDEANCNLNAGTGDTDTDDDVARWVATTTPIAPARDAEDLHALATGIGGGSMGLAALGTRLVAVIDEAADDENHDLKANDHELVAWLDPTSSNPTWDFTHQSSNPSHGTGVFDDDGDSEPFAGTSWMAPAAVGNRLALVFLEEVPGTNADVGSLNTNLDCNLVAKDSDKTDGLPVWADFESGPTLDFDGMGYAVDKANAGMELVGLFAFFRVSEADDGRDYNNDGQMNDVVLFRNPLTTCGPVAMATSTVLPSAVITTDGEAAAAFLSSESQAGVDFNEDGDTTDLVVRYFRF